MRRLLIVQSVMPKDLLRINSTGLHTHTHTHTQTLTDISRHIHVFESGLVLEQGPFSLVRAVG